MSGILTRVVALALALLPAELAAQASTPASAAVAEAERIMAEYADPDAPGAVAAVVSRGDVVYVNAVGLASLEQRTRLAPTSILDIGSVAKQFTAYAIVLLESRGKLSLDDDIRVHLPEVPDFADPITIRQLLTHTSGLREIYNTATIGGRRGGDAMTQEDALRVVRAQPSLQFAPGSEHLYNNTGYMLLADIVERVTGEEFHVWMRDEVFAPLGMTSTVVMHTLGQVIPRSADSYELTEDSNYVRIFDNSTIQGAGGVYTNVEDLTRWLRTWVDARPETAPLLERLQQRAVLTSGDTLDYALGVNVGFDHGLRTIRHTGSSAGFRTVFAVYPEIRGGVIVQSNFADFETGDLAEELSRAFFGEHMDVAAADDADSDDDDDDDEDSATWTPAADALAEYAGTFYSAEIGTVYRFSVRADTLILRHRRIGELALEPREPDVFRAGHGLGTLRFDRDAAGSVAGFTISNGRTRGVRFERLRTGR